MEAVCRPHCRYVSIRLYSDITQKPRPSQIHIYLLDVQFQVLDVLLEARKLLFELLLALEQLVAGIFFLLQPFLCVLEAKCSNSEVLLYLETKPTKSNQKVKHGDLGKMQFDVPYSL
jgi:hypothetical protein